ncbi:hypothetical protein J6590_030170 [Homalodisca vitripennis]|nr:hypothetical protein J6590_030170 [Homalodisca vitripennis]
MAVIRGTGTPNWGYFIVHPELPTMEPVLQCWQAKEVALRVAIRGKHGVREKSIFAFSGHDPLTLATSGHFCQSESPANANQPENC